MQHCGTLLLHRLNFGTNFLYVRIYQEVSRFCFDSLLILNMHYLLFISANSYPSVTQNETRNTTTIFNVTELECREDFIVINATCHPRCDKFIQSPYTATIFLMVAELLAAVVVIIASVLIGIFVISKLATL